MAKAQPEPFDFTDLIEDGAAPQTQPETLADAADPSGPPLVDASEVDLARQQGVAEGEQNALDTLAAQEAESLRSIASALASREFNFEEAIGREKIALRESAGAFLEQFCAGVLSEREIELAETLLCQILSASENRSHATLFLNPDSVHRLRERLDTLLDNHGVSNAFSYDGDRELSPGECRVEWHGGAIRRTNAEIKKAMADIFGPADDQKSAPAKKTAGKANPSEPKS